MQVVKQEISGSPVIILKEADKSLKILYAGNLDLYWIFYSNNLEEDNTILITKENVGLYEKFEALFTDIDQINIFRCDNFSHMY